MQTKTNGTSNGVLSRNGTSTEAGANGQLDGSNHENGDSYDQERTADALGKMKISKNETLYVGSSHWAAILKDVSYFHLGPSFHFIPLANKDSDRRCQGIP